MEEKKDFHRPGRGGFSGRRGFYGPSRGYNSRNFGEHTWTFYDDNQWKNFQEWMRNEKTREKEEDTKIIIKGIEQIIEKRLGKEETRKMKKRTNKGKGKKQNSSSDEENSEDDMSADDYEWEKEK